MNAESQLRSALLIISIAVSAAFCFQWAQPYYSEKRKNEKFYENNKDIKGIAGSLFSVFISLSILEVETTEFRNMNIVPMGFET